MAASLMVEGRALKGHRVRVYVAAFLADMLAYAYHALVPVYALKTFSASPVVLGSLGTTVTGSYAITCFVSGRWSDRAGSVPLCIGGLALAALVALPIAFVAPHVEWLYAAGALLGIGLGLFWPPLERQLALLSPRSSLWRTVGTFNASWAGGIALGSLVGPNLYDITGFEFGMATCAFLAVLTALLLVGRFPAAASAKRSAGADIGAPDRDRAELFLRMARIANFAALFAFHGVAYQLPYVSERLGFSLAALGVLLLTPSAGRFVSFLLLRQLGGWQNSLWWLAGLQLLAAVGVGSLVLATSVPVFVALLPWLGIFTGLSYFSSLFYGLRGGTAQGAHSGLHEGILALGMTLGPLASGLGWRILGSGPGTVFAPAALVLAATLVLELWMAWRASKR